VQVVALIDEAPEGLHAGLPMRSASGCQRMSDMVCLFLFISQRGICGEGQVLSPQGLAGKLRHLCQPATINVPRRAAHLAAGLAAQEQHQLAQLRRCDELQRRLLLGQQIMLRLLRIAPVARSSICFCTSGVSTQPGQMALQVTLLVAVSRPTTLVSPTTPCLAAT
jgi:hypothetical protein